MFGVGVKLYRAFTLNPNISDPIYFPSDSQGARSGHPLFRTQENSSNTLHLIDQFVGVHKQPHDQPFQIHILYCERER